MVWPQIVLFGDSLTQFSWQEGGTGAALQDFFQRKFDVVNRGFSGFNSEWGLRFAERVFPEAVVEDIACLVIWFGANDSLLPDEAQAVPLERYKANLRTLVDLVPLETPVILINPPPFGPLGRSKYLGLPWDEGKTKLERTKEWTAVYAQACLDVGKDLKAGEKGRYLTVINLHDELEAAAFAFGKGSREEGMEQYLCDGVHLGPGGYKVVTAAILKALKEDHPGVYNKVQEFPDWQDVDHRDPDRYLPRLGLTHE
ncbi:hypothetical protein JCM6882_004368 [Rhodosporidiobolus microsporus]